MCTVVMGGRKETNRSGRKIGRSEKKSREEIGVECSVDGNRIDEEKERE